MFPSIVSPKINNIKKFIENFEEKEDYIRNDLFKLNFNSNNSTQTESNFANGQTFDLSRFEVSQLKLIYKIKRNLQSSHYIEKFNKGIEDILMNLNQEKYNLNSNLECEDKINSFQSQGEKLLEKPISEFKNPSREDYSDHLLEKIKSMNAQQQDIFSMISNDYKRSYHLFHELKQINVCFNKTESNNLNYNLGKINYLKFLI